MAIKRGDTVQVELPDGWFIGKVTDVRPDPWSDERRVHIEGRKPRHFITQVRESSAVLVEEE